MSLFTKEVEVTDRYGSTSTEIRPRIGMIAVTAVVVVVGFIFLIALAANPPFKKTPRDKIGLSYGGGPLEGAHFQGVKQPGSGLFFNGWSDKLYLYPVTQRNYIISKRVGEGDIAGGDHIEAVTKDNVAVEWEVATYFKLNTNKLQQFHEQIGLKYHAWTSGGWNDMLNDSFRQQIENALQDETRRYNIADIYSNRDTLVTIQDEIGAALKTRVADSLGGDYFCGPTFSLKGGTGCPDFTFIVKRITVPDKVKAAFEDNRTSQIEVQTKQNEIAQRQAEAEAIAKLNEALAQSGESYVQLKYIEFLNALAKNGGVQFWGLPAGTNVTVPTGQASK